MLKRGRLFFIEVGENNVISYQAPSQPSTPPFRYSTTIHCFSHCHKLMACGHQVGQQPNKRYAPPYTCQLWK